MQTSRKKDHNGTGRMKVSIAMATYNGAAYLQEQLVSFVQQTRLPDELVVCDDGSADDTQQILLEFKKAAPFQVRINVNPSNLGFTKNFSNAMQRCTGDLVFLADQDDIWDANKVARILEVFKAFPWASLVVHDGRLVDSGLTWSGATNRGQVLSGFGSDASLTTGALTVYKRELGQIALPVPEGIVGHDQWLHQIALLIGKRLVISDVLQSVRRHAANTSGGITSSLMGVSRWDVFKEQWRTPVSSSYEDRLLINDSARQRLTRIALGKSTDFSLAEGSRALSLLADERQALLARQTLSTRGWLARKALAIRLAWSGGYRHFNGYRSFLRDMVR
jgi:hypothetical protein